MTTSQLTFTRFIAAFLLFVYHFGEIENSEHLNLGVSYFYVLSGFVMILAYGKKEHISPKEYYINRLARIYPLHIMTLLLAIAANIFKYINYLEYVKFDIPSMLMNALLIHAWIPQISLSYNVPSWSISVEMFFYLLFPFIFNYVIKKWKLKYIAIFTLSFWLVCQIGMNIFYFSEYYGGYNSLDRYFLKFNPFLHLNSFLVGILFGLVFQNMHLFNFKAGNYDILVIITTLGIILLIYLTRNLLIHNGFHSITFGGLILLITLNTGRITKIFNNKHLIYLGEISFALYLLQIPIGMILTKIFSATGIKNHTLFFCLSFIVVMIASHFSYKYIEIPARNKIKKLFGNA